MLLRDACGLVRMDQQPAIEALALLAFAGIGPMFPWVLGIEPLLPQIGVISRVGIVAARRMQPVIALIGLEAAFGKMDADDGIGTDAETLHPLKVCRHMCLADQRAADTDLTQVIAKCRLAHTQRNAVLGRTMRTHVAACIALMREGPQTVDCT